MTAKGHILLALTPVAILEPEFFTRPEYLGIIALGALAPDIDEPKSFIGRRFYFISYPLRFLGIKHRTITHSLLIPFFLFSLGMFFYNVYLLLFAYAYFIHLVGDMLTKTGIPAIYPLSNKYYALLPLKMRFRTGSVIEYILIVLLFALIVYFLNKNNIHIQDLTLNLQNFYYLIISHLNEFEIKKFLSLL